MKTTILSLTIALAATFGTGAAAFAGTTDTTQTTTVLSNVKNFNSLEVHGNVQVYLTSGSEDKVITYNNYYNENALVQEENAALRITSYNTEKLVVWVTVKDLSKLSVYDNAEVKSFGDFTAIDLDVKLYNQALAQLDVNAFSASFTVNDRARADLSGSIENGALFHDRMACLNTGNLTITSLSELAGHHPKHHFHQMQFASL